MSQTDTVNLQEVEVKSIRPDITTQSANPVQLMTSKRLDALPTASVADAIRNFSGVVVKDYGGIGGLKTVMIRSMGANHTAVFVDGMQQTDASTGQTDLGRIPLNSIGSIELSVGQAAFDLKPARMYASASVMDINSIEYDFKKEKDFLGITLKNGSFGSINPLISYDRKFNNAITSGIRLNYYKSNGQYPFENRNGLTVEELTRANSDIESFDGHLRSSITLNDSSSIRIKASWYKSVRGLPGAVIFYNPHSSQRLKNTDLITSIQFKDSPKKRIRKLLSIGFSDSRLIYRDPEFLNQSGGLRNEYNQQEYYLSGAVGHQIIKKLQFNLSTDLIYNKLSSNAYLVKSPSRTSSLTAASFKSSFKKTEIQASLLMTVAYDKTEEINIKGYFKLTPAFSAIHSITRDHALKARFMFKRTFRMPSFNDLYYTISGNNILSPEDASLYNAGFLYNKAFGQSTSVTFRTDGFINYVTNKIVTVPTRNLFIWSTKNIGKVDIAGIELYTGVTHSFNDDWAVDISGNYTYQDASDVTNKADANYGNQITYIPYETAGILGVIYYKLYSIGINYLFNGYRYYTPANDNSSLLPSWNTIDLTITRKWMFKDNKFDIKLEVLNSLNEQYEVVKGFPMTGRAFYLSLTAVL